MAHLSPEDLEYVFHSECFEDASQRLLVARSNGNRPSGRAAAADMLTHLKRLYDLARAKHESRELVA
jgi:hypothetical protein